jgi:vancomycin resistance protein YoaR
MFILALSPRHLKTSILTLLVLAIVLVCSYVFVAFAYSGSAVSNAKLDGMDIGGMDTETFKEFVSKRVDELRKTPILLTVHQKPHSFQPEELGIVYDAEKTVDQVLTSQGEGIKYYVSVVSNLVNTREFQTVVSFDKELASEAIYGKIEELKRPSNAQLMVENGKWRIVPSEMGYDTNMDELLDRMENYLRIAGKREFSLVTNAKHPSFTTEEAEWLLADVRKLTEKEHALKVHVGNKEQIFPINFNDSEEWVVITRSNEEDWEASLNEVMILQRIIDDISPLIEREVHNVEIKEFNEVNGRLYADTEGIAQDGLKIDLAKTLESITSNVKEGITETEIVAQKIPAKITTPAGSPFEFPQRISAGLSNYATSSPERIHNVKLGLSKFHNRVLAPGESLAYNEHVLPITNEAGYENELAIFGGGGLKKVPGGGLCQVSTTVYRAFFNGGYEILERYPHSLYVHYYTAYQDGLDATIYPGYGEWKGKDLRIKNDSPHHLLVQTYTNDDTLDAVVQIYGTSDGREVEIDGPHYLANTWIGTEYVEDPDLPVGYEKTEANGSYGKLIQWNRKITYDDGQEKDEEIFSRYNAKKKVVRVGIGGGHGVQ